LVILFRILYFLFFLRAKCERDEMHARATFVSIAACGA